MRLWYRYKAFSWIMNKERLAVTLPSLGEDAFALEKVLTERLNRARTVYLEDPSVLVSKLQFMAELNRNGHYE
jgi:ATP-dependent Zn protease